MTATLTQAALTHHPVVTRDQWIAQRKALLAQEKALSHQTDELARQRRALPWVRIDKTYVFDTPQGQLMLTALSERCHMLEPTHVFGEESGRDSAFREGERSVLLWMIGVAEMKLEDLLSIAAQAER